MMTIVCEKHPHNMVPGESNKKQTWFPREEIDVYTSSIKPINLSMLSCVCLPQTFVLNPPFHSQTHLP